MPAEIFASSSSMIGLCRTSKKLRRYNPVDAASGESACVSFTSLPPFELPASWGTMAQLAGNSLTVESGEIIGSRAGFHHATPGRLLAIREVERLKDMGGLQRG
jgi:hypothetical protein